LTAPAAYGKARALLMSGCLISAPDLPINANGFRPGAFGGRPRRGITMVKPEWGAKHGCPKCGTRFYDLGKDDPITCIECGHAWQPEPVLKSKQPIPYEEVKKQPEVADVDLAEEDLDIDEDGDSPDNDVDLGGDEDLGVGVDGEDADEV
jgi:hypothetical protein